MNKTIRTITAEGIHVNLGFSELVAPLPFELPEGATAFTHDTETGECNWLNEDETEGTATITDADLTAALAYEPPPYVPPVPESLTRREFHLAAASIGITKDAIIFAISQIDDDQQRLLAQIDYEESRDFRRDWPMLALMASDLGITEQQLDDLFRLGATYRNKPAVG